MTRDASLIHPSAVIAASAHLGPGVEIGPYSVIGPQVSIGEKTWIGPHVVIDGRTTIGRENRIFQFASIGAIPQDKKYCGEESQLIIGDGNAIREFATLHTGTAGGGMITRIGNANLLMNYSHVAHDCQIGNHVVLANGATLAGHVKIEDYVTVGGLVAIHQFTRIGESVLLAGGAMVSQDVPPYCIATGDRAHLTGLNLIGLKRRGFTNEEISALKKAYRTLFAEGLPLKEAILRLQEEHEASVVISHLIAFLEESQRGVCRPRGTADPEGGDESL